MNAGYPVIRPRRLRRTPALRALVAETSLRPGQLVLPVFVKEGISAKPFRFDDLRRTVETMMASMRISKDTRAQIQSHGLSGVQTRHYDRHDYADEKLIGLGAWAAHLDSLAHAKPAPSNVKQLRQASN